MSERNKIIVVLGPTASGKSDIAVKLAKKFNGEVISADSRQVYKGLNIGTGKITKKEMGGIKHHLLDVVSSILRLHSGQAKRFTAFDFVKITKKTIVQIVIGGRLPIVCGGTGFYIDALLGERQIPEVAPDMALRKKLEEKSSAELFKILQKLDPVRARSIDAKNPRRLIRAIEICEALGKVPPLREGFSGQAKYEVLKIGVAPEAKELRERINMRLARRIKAGMIEESKRLHRQGLTYKRMRELGLEYGALADLLDKKIDKKEMEERLQKEIWHYAKRQMTWFKRDKKTNWFKPSEISKIEKYVRDFLRLT